jgi:hypothetical protein
MEAAAQIFEGNFDDVADDDGDVQMQEDTVPPSRSDVSKRKAELVIHLTRYWRLLFS